MLSILGDILDYSKIEAGKLEMRSENFELKKICQECLTIFRGIAESKSLVLKIHFSSSLPNFVYGDPVRIKQILINLIGNAVKFTEKGSVSLEVDQIDEEKEIIQFLIKDNGIGMSPETLKILFQPYTQADASSSRKYGGMGLGLAICNRLTAMMGGSISVESKMGEGSQFKVALPLPKKEGAQTVLDGKENGNGNGNGNENESKGASSISKINSYQSETKILLVEDNAINQMVAIKILEKLGVKVEVAIDGAEAVKSEQLREALQTWIKTEPRLQEKVS